MEVSGGGGGSIIPRSLSIAHSKFSLAPGSRTLASNRVIVNVGGVRYETFKSTLRSIPDTRLSWLTEAPGHNPDYDPATGEYFFDRHPGVFNMILNYYRTGKLHAPTDVCGPLFEEELAFWGIDEKQIEPCCWPAYRAHRDAQETLAEFDSDRSDGSDGEDEDVEIARRFGIVEEARGEKQGFARWQPRVWHLLEDPNSSVAAKILAMVSVVFVLLYIAIFVAESHVLFRDVRTDLKNVTLSDVMTVRELQRVTRPKLWLSVLEYTCVAYFTLELAARAVFCPEKAAYYRQALTWIDIFSVLPFYAHELAVLVDSSLEDSVGLYVLKSLRAVRILRIMRLTRYFSGLKILGHTLKASAKELLLMILVLGIGVLFFASFIYYAEQVEEGDKNDFKNIPVGFWWAVVTMTTLGYGDTYPRTALGYIVGAICALCGLLMLALPVPVIVNNFTLYYSHAQAKLKLPQKRKNVLVGAADALKNAGSNTPPDGGGGGGGGGGGTTTAESSIDVALMKGQGSLSTMGSAASVASLAAEVVKPAADFSYSSCSAVPPGNKNGVVPPGSKDPVSASSRKVSDDSNQDSVDSGFKTGSASTNGEARGISVIFTDEVNLSPPPARFSSPTITTTSPAPSRRTSGHNRTSYFNGSVKRASSRRRSLRPSNMRVDIVDIADVDV